MNEPRSVLVLFVTLLLALFVSVSVIDVFAYDQSEPLPVVNIPWLAMRVVESAAKHHAVPRPNRPHHTSGPIRYAFNVLESLDFMLERSTRLAVSLRC